MKTTKENLIKLIRLCKEDIINDLLLLLEDEDLYIPQKTLDQTCNIVITHLESLIDDVCFN